MRFKGTIFLTVVLIALGAYLLWYELPQEKKRLEEEARAQRVLDLKNEEVTGLLIEEGGKEIELERHLENPDQKWQVIRPLVGPANDATAAAALSVIENLKYTRVIEEEPETLKPFGLDPPEFSVTVVIKRREVERIDFGKSNPAGSDVYVKRLGDPRVLLVGSGVTFGLKKELKEWRRRRILIDHPGNVKEMTLQYPKRTLVLDQESDGWRIKRPKALPADPSKVGGFLNSLFFLQTDDFIDKDKKEMKASLGNPYAVVTYQVHEIRRDISFYKQEGTPDVVFAVTHLEDPIYRVRQADVGFLMKDLNDFRDKSLIRLASQSAISEMEIRRQEEDYRLIRREGGWEISDGTRADENKVLHLLAELQATTAERFLDDPAEVPERVRSSQATIVLKDEKQQVLAEVTLGQAIKGGGLYGNSRFQPTPFVVKESLLDAIPKKSDLAESKEASETAPKTPQQPSGS